MIQTLTENLAKACGFSSAAEMYSSEVQDLMERYFMSKEYADWNKYSKERFKFEVVVRNCKQGVGRLN